MNRTGNKATKTYAQCTSPHFTSPKYVYHYQSEIRNYHSGEDSSLGHLGCQAM